MRRALVIIDPQVGFCDPKGMLPVAGADKDMERAAALIKRVKFDEIHITMDMHHPLSIERTSFWMDSKGNEVKPFTQILHDDVVKGTYTPRNPRWRQKGLDYTLALEKGGRKTLVTWTPHCTIGSNDACIFPPIQEALTWWENTRQQHVDYVAKGSNPFTEHYSPFRAEVPDPNDPTTMLNLPLIQTVELNDITLFLGEALSHCLADGAMDIIENFHPDNIKKLALVIDCSSPVKNFEHLADEFIKKATKLGMQIVKSTEI